MNFKIIIATIIASVAAIPFNATPLTAPLSNITPKGQEGLGAEKLNSVSTLESSTNEVTEISSQDKAQSGINKAAKPISTTSSPNTSGFDDLLEFVKSVSPESDVNTIVSEEAKKDPSANHATKDPSADVAPAPPVAPAAQPEA